MQGVVSKEDALELVEYIGACSSLQLRGLAADYGLPEVCRSPASLLCWRNSGLDIADQSSAVAGISFSACERIKHGII